MIRELEKREANSHNPAIFLDRDGVIIENRSSYVRSWADVLIYPQALAVLAWVSRFPVKIVIVTNQSVVGRGLISLQAAQQINTRLMLAIKREGGRVDGIYMCPHHPIDNCGCRKPQPGLFYQAAEELNIDLACSIMIGDALTDLQAGLAAGLLRSVLVRTGRGQSQESLARSQPQQHFAVYDTLALALRSETSRQFSR